jgi:hypothetical protein
MHAIVRPTRIDIDGSNGLPNDSWTPWLDELKAIHMPGLMQTAKRIAVAVTHTGQMNASIYRTGMTDEEVIRVLEKYGIEAYTEADLAKMQPFGRP